MRARGFSLVELLIVIAVMGIILSIATLNFNNLQRKTGVENQARTMFADLLSVRSQALYTRTNRAVKIDSTTFSAFSSTTTGSTGPVSRKQISYTPIFNTTGSSMGGKVVFDVNGIANSVYSGFSTVCIVPQGNLNGDVPAAVDSIIISQTKMTLGKRRQGAACGKANVDEK